MNASDAKYFLAYLVPVVIFVSLYWAGPMSFFAVAFLFGFIPLLEHLLPEQTQNLSPEAERARKRSRLFDYLLYANLPIQYGLLAYFLWSVSTRELAAYELWGMVLAMGTACGTLGINVGHELGHRSHTYEQRMAQALLLSSLYLHFFIEHNRGHHKHVATPHDPATAAKGQSVYAFWWQSIVGGYRSAWKLEGERLTKRGLPWLSRHNLMLVFQLVQLAFVLAIGLLIGWNAMWLFVAAALVGILELETVNYVEHYGLRRRELRPGVYERVLPVHSWNTDRSIGRILLYELTRHSDHHFLASRKYQVLRRFEESPQLPSGYPAMMVISLIPPLWFFLMNRSLQRQQARSLRPELAS